MSRWQDVLRHNAGSQCSVRESSAGIRGTAASRRQTMGAESDTESGQTFLITGGNTGIGLATATELARRGGRVYVACRSEAKGSHAVASIVAATGNAHVSYLPLDLSDLGSVRACAKEFLATGQSLHALIN